MRLSQFAFAVILTLTSCGADEEENASFRCSKDGEVTCNPDEEYCVRTYDGDVQTAASCHPIPEGCSECGCIQEDEPVVDACGGTTACTSVNDSNFRVEC